VPYISEGFAAESIIPLSDRRVYPENRFPAAQWDYQLFYRENFAAARAGFESNVRAAVRALFRAGDPAGKGKPARTAFVRANGGWFGAQPTAPNLPRDAAVLGEEDENRYVAALERNGFFGPDSWYMNAEPIRPISSVAQTKKILTIVWTHLKRRLTPPRWVCPAFQAGGFYEIANRAIVPDTESGEPRYIRQSS
jgi:hypothetical protein